MIIMITFQCSNCGERREANVLPGKHAVQGTLNQLNKKSDCCPKPDYTDSGGFRKDTVQKDLRQLAPSPKA